MVWHCHVIVQNVLNKLTSANLLRTAPALPPVDWLRSASSQMAVCSIEIDGSNRTFAFQCGNNGTKAAGVARRWSIVVSDDHIESRDQWQVIRNLVGKLVQTKTQGRVQREDANASVKVFASFNF